MSNLHYDFTCPHCGQAFLPLLDVPGGNVCPECTEECEVLDQPPLISEIVAVAWSRVKSREVSIQCCADKYVALTWSIVLDYLMQRDPIPPQRAKAVAEHIVDGILREGGLADTYREHMSMFVEAVITTFDRMVQADLLHGWKGQTDSLVIL